MTKLTITGDVDPFLHVTLTRGEIIHCESDAMVMMESQLELRGSMQGGILQAALRRLANGESFFLQKIEAVRGDGECLLAPTTPGAIQVLEVGPKQYRLSDGAFLAATDTVQVTARSQGVGRALLGSTGGFFIGETSGNGQLAISGFGSIFMIEVHAGNDIVVDNGHVVAWDADLRYDISAATRSNSGLIGNLVNSVTSGEGLVLRFSGNGKVVMCSRNRQGFLDWLASKIKVPGR